MINYKKKFIMLTIAIILTICSSCGFLLHTSESKVIALATPSPLTTTVNITKSMNNSYIISSGSSRIGTFEVNYNILGTQGTIKKEQQIIISTIMDDFDKSPIIGYVKNSSPPSEQQKQLHQQQSTISNPFVDEQTVNQKIKSEIRDILSKSINNTNSNLFIQCKFGMNLTDWKCNRNE